MKAEATVVLAGVGWLLAGCTSPVCQPGYVTMVPSTADEDVTGRNNQQVALFLSRDPGWQAWLYAIFLSQQADDDLVDASRLNTPVWKIIDAISVAQGAYRMATSFALTPFTVTSSCLDRYPEVTGSVKLSNGLVARYSAFMNETTYFENGTSCRVSVGLVDEIDSSRGLPIATASGSQSIDWRDSFSRYLVWHQPYWTISTGTKLSLPDMVDLIEN